MYDIIFIVFFYVLCRDFGLSVLENCIIILNVRILLDSNELMCSGGKVIK